MRLNFKNVNTCKLHDELIKTGITPVLVESTPRQNDQDNSPIRPDTYITVDDNQVDAVNAVVTAHDPTPTVQPPTAEERISALETLVLQLGGVI